jgi:hypothetical protein
VTPETIELYKAGRRASLGPNPAVRRSVEEEIASAPYPDSLPAYRMLQLDREGNLWVQSYVPRGSKDPTGWSVFNAEGRWVTDISLPSSWQVADIGRDYILTIETNELGVEMVRMYKLSRGVR